MRYFISFILVMLIPIAVSAQITISYSYNGEKFTFDQLLKKAESGDVGVQEYVGMIYFAGYNVPQDYKKAYEWFFKAADQGNAYAQYHLGKMHESGEGVPQDYRKADEWYQKAAIQGLASAQNNLGAMYFNSLLGSPDIVTGCVWIYLSKDAQNSKICDKSLNKDQKKKVLSLMEQLKKENPLIK
jgi:TPR repeat protein